MYPTSRPAQRIIYLGRDLPILADVSSPTPARLYKKFRSLGYGDNLLASTNHDGESRQPGELIEELRRHGMLPYLISPHLEGIPCLARLST